MGKFRKRPIIVEARRTWLREVIKTLEGDMIAEPGDWIITGVLGEKYPCKHHIFVRTYEPVRENLRRKTGENLGRRTDAICKRL